MDSIYLFPLAIILGYVIFRLLLKLFYPFFVLIHEFGHALPAAVSGKQRISVTIGDEPHATCFKLPGIVVKISFKRSEIGKTYYEGKPENWTELLFIVGSAPLLSLMISIVLGWVLLSFKFHLLVLMLLCAAWLANTHIVLGSLWPVGFRDSNGQFISSDLLTILKGPKE